MVWPSVPPLKIGAKTGFHEIELVNPCFSVKGTLLRAPDERSALLWAVFYSYIGECEVEIVKFV